MSDDKHGTTTSQSVVTENYSMVLVKQSQTQTINAPLVPSEARRLANWLYMKHNVHYYFEVLRYKKPTELAFMLRTDGYDVKATEILVAIKRAEIKNK